MIALYPPPSSGPLDPLAAIEAEDRPAPAGRPYVLSNMIESADGATALDGVSGGLGGPADQAVFGALRAIADMILVGSATVDAEDYRPPGPGSDAVQAGRRQRGQATRPTVVVVTASASLAPDRRLFSDPDNRPIVATVSAAPRERVAALAAVADVIECGRTRSTSRPWPGNSIDGALEPSSPRADRRSMPNSSPTTSSTNGTSRLRPCW